MSALLMMLIFSFTDLKKYICLDQWKLNLQEWAAEMSYQVKVLATESDSLGLSSETHIMGTGN